MEVITHEPGPTSITSFAREHASSHARLGLVRSMHREPAMADVFESQEIDATQYLGEGQVRCGFCQGNYSVHLEVVCGDCERQLCPLCATRSRRIYRCPECSPTDRFAVLDQL